MGDEAVFKMMPMYWIEKSEGKNRGRPKFNASMRIKKEAFKDFIKWSGAKVSTGPEEADWMRVFLEPVRWDECGELPPRIPRWQSPSEMEDIERSDLGIALGEYGQVGSRKKQEHGETTERRKWRMSGLPFEWDEQDAENFAREDAQFLDPEIKSSFVKGRNGK